MIGTHDALAAIAAIDALAAIDLAGVAAGASLLTRVDHKYVVPAGEIAGFVDRLALPVLEVGGRRRLRYESVYFDTPGWHLYLDGARARSHRRKVRTRSYLDDQRCLLEVKSKDHRGRTVKERAEHGFIDRAQLTDAGRAFVAAHAAELADRPLAATITTRYVRSTLVDVPRSTRVTIDTDVTFDDPSGRGTAMTSVAIVETKSADGCGPADRLLWAAGHRPEALSKYGLGAAALHPDLPANRWRRALDRHVRRA